LLIIFFNLYFLKINNEFYHKDLQLTAGSTVDLIGHADNQYRYHRICRGEACILLYPVSIDIYCFLQSQLR
jgi:hypothetical protein